MKKTSDVSKKNGILITNKICNILKKNGILSTNEIFDLLKNDISKKNLNVKLNRMNKGDCLHITKGYYGNTKFYFEHTNIVFEKIYMLDSKGIYSGETLLNKYKYLDQVPFKIQILSTCQRKILVKNNYNINYLDNSLKTIDSWLLEMFELIKQLKIYNIEIDYLTIVRKVIKKHKLEREDLNKIKVISGMYYYESFKLNNRKEKIINDL